MQVFFESIKKNHSFHKMQIGDNKCDKREGKLGNQEGRNGEELKTDRHSPKGSKITSYLSLPRRYLLITKGTISNFSVFN